MVAKKVEVKDTHPDREQSRREYQLLLAAFRRLLDIHENGAERKGAFEDIITLRASFLVGRVISGLGMDLDRALDILRNHHGSATGRRKQERGVLAAAVDNLVDFAAAQELQVFKELPGTRYADHTGSHEAVFEKYNLTYAAGENMDVLYAAGIAAWWMTVPENNYITFMTQGDERVRPWHLSHDGLTFLKRDFPPELIPPIEYGCRCFLVSGGVGPVHASLGKGKPVRNVNPVFRESLATGGRIFSPAHPYFMNLPDETASAVIKRIKQKMYVR
ncbi:structural protein [Dysgonomonas termitidis]|uniref:Phage head morphogenesis domain-containing protein n=1 Tax=Dysgonomonas termitidis TaxID=1516126 RepID=A0ABV9KRT7_9BACT